MLCGSDDCGTEKQVLRAEVAKLNGLLRDTLPYVLNTATQARAEGQTWRAETAEAILENVNRELGIV